MPAGGHEAEDGDQGEERHEYGQGGAVELHDRTPDIPRRRRRRGRATNSW